jgi:hypothetical protein
MSCKVPNQFAEIVKLKVLAKQLATGLQFYLNFIENGLPDSQVITNPCPPEVAAELIAEAEAL